MTSASSVSNPSAYECSCCGQKSVVEEARTWGLIHFRCENPQCEHSWAVSEEAVEILSSVIHRPGECAVGADANGFMPLQELPPVLPPAPTLPEDLLPPVLKPWLLDIAERLQVALEFVAVPALVGITAVIGRRVAIHPKALDDWLVVVNLWGMIVGRPGTLKSPTLGGTLQPIHRLEREARKEHARRSLELRAQLDVLKEKEKATKHLLRRLYLGNGTGTEAEHRQALRDIRAEMEDVERKLEMPRYVVNDATVEKIGALLAKHPQGLLHERDELSGWLRALDRRDRKGDREFFLEAWNGTNPYTYDRIGRGTIHVPALCLSMIGGIQPSKLAQYVAGAVDGGYGDDGLLQRFQLIVYPENRKCFDLVDRRPNEGAAAAVRGVVSALVQLGGQPSGREPMTLRFTPEAQELFNDWLSNLETRLRSSEFEETPAFESHLAKYRSLMPSLALIFHLVDQCSGSEHLDNGLLPVSLEAARLAADWCDFLELHARKVYAVASGTGRGAARALASKIKAGKVADETSIRDIYRHGWSRLSTSADAHQAVRILEAHGWLRTETRNDDGAGRPSQIIRLNPRLGEV